MPLWGHWSERPLNKRDLQRSSHSLPSGKGLPTTTSPHYGVKSLGTTSIGASEPGFKQREKGVSDRVDGVELESKHPPFPQHDDLIENIKTRTL